MERKGATIFAVLLLGTGTAPEVGCPTKKLLCAMLRTRYKKLQSFYNPVAKI
jgi:hypothetical protein